MTNNHPNEAEPLLPPSSSKRKVPSTFQQTTHLIACLISAFSAGWHDASIGALLPFLKIYYPNVTDSTLSLIFIASFVGYIVACLWNVRITRFWGVKAVLGVGAIVQGVGSLFIAGSVLFDHFHVSHWKIDEKETIGQGNVLGFSIMVAGFTIAGAGLAVQDAAYNTFVSRLDGKEGKLGVLHATYGIGALVCPVFVMLFVGFRFGVERPLVFFLSNAGWSVVCLLVLWMSYLPRSSKSDSSEGSLIGVDREENVEERENDLVSFQAVMKYRVVWTAILFIALYTGSEATQSSWIITFLLRSRPSSPLSHYASTAYYTGLTTSRIALLPLTNYLGARYAITVYIFLAFISQVSIAVINNLKADLVVIAIAGFVMGPCYPVTVGCLTGSLEDHFHPGALAALGLFARAGTAVFPFLVGVLADLVGVGVLPFVMAGLFVGMGVVWWGVPFSGKVVGGIDLESDDDDDARNV